MTRRVRAPTLRKPERGHRARENRNHLLLRSGVLPTRPIWRIPPSHESFPLQRIRAQHGRSVARRRPRVVLGGSRLGRPRPSACKGDRREASSFRNRSRAPFLGRAGTCAQTRSVLGRQPLSNTYWAFLDPVFILRRARIHPPRAAVRLTFTLPRAAGHPRALFGPGGQYRETIKTFERVATLALDPCPRSNWRQSGDRRD